MPGITDICQLSAKLRANFLPLWVEKCGLSRLPQCFAGVEDNDVLCLS